MSRQPYQSWAGAEADRQRNRVERHSNSCTCIRCVGPERVRAIAIQLKAERDEDDRRAGRVPPRALWSQMTKEERHTYRMRYRAEMKRRMAWAKDVPAEE